MRKATSFVIAAVMSLSTLFLADPAQAHSWRGYGPGFRIGGIDLSIFFGQPSFSRHDDYYYRSARPFHYREHRCHDACFRDGGYYYHHDRCPVVAYHFNRYGTHRDDVFRRYGPRYDRNDRYDRYDRYDRHDRYDRYDRDRHDRYDRDRRGRDYDRHDRYDRYERDRRDRRDRWDDDDRHRGRGRGHYDHGRGRGRGHDRDYGRDHRHSRDCGHRY